jgi:hypothetical protein
VVKSLLGITLHLATVNSTGLWASLVVQLWQEFGRSCGLRSMHYPEYIRQLGPGCKICVHKYDSIIFILQK